MITISSSDVCIGVDVVDPVIAGVHYLGQIFTAGVTIHFLFFAECNVGSDCSVVERLSGSEIVTERSLLHDRRVSLSQTLEHLHLLSAEVQRLVHHHPGHRLPAARVGGAPLVGHVVPGVGQEAGEGHLVNPGRVSSVLDLGQFGHKSVQA